MSYGIVSLKDYEDYLKPVFEILRLALDYSDTKLRNEINELMNEIKSTNLNPELQNTLLKELDSAYILLHVPFGAKKEVERLRNKITDILDFQSSIEATIDKLSEVEALISNAILIIRNASHNIPAEQQLIIIPLEKNLISIHSDIIWLIRLVGATIRLLFDVIRDYCECKCECDINKLKELKSLFHEILSKGGYLR